MSSSDRIDSKPSSGSDRKKTVGEQHSKHKRVISVIGCDNPAEYEAISAACPDGTISKRISSFNDPAVRESIMSSEVTIVNIKSERDGLKQKIEWIYNQKPENRVILIGGLDQETSSMHFPRVFTIIRPPLYNDICNEVIRQAFNGGGHHEKRIEPRIAMNLPVEVYFVNRFWGGRTANISMNGMQTVWETDSSASRKSTGNLLPALTMREAQTAFMKLYTEGSPGPDSEHLNLKGEIRYRQVSERAGTARIGFEFKDLDMDLRLKLYGALA